MNWVKLLPNHSKLIPKTTQSASITHSFIPLGFTIPTTKQIFTPSDRLSLVPVTTSAHLQLLKNFHVSLVLCISVTPGLTPFSCRGNFKALYLNRIQPSNFYFSLVQSPNQIGFLLMSSNNQVVGEITCRIIDSFHQDQVNIYIQTLSISPEFRRLSMTKKFFLPAVICSINHQPSTYLPLSDSVQVRRETDSKELRFLLHVSYNNLRAIKAYNRMGFNKLSVGSRRENMICTLGRGDRIAMELLW
jgi:ribosomal protein S18 acetylase RimI-like enzyme